MDTVLITAIGSFAADIVIKNLKPDFKVIGCDIYPKEWIADAYNVDIFLEAPLVKNEKEYLHFVYDLCAKYAVKYIIPLTDIEVDVFNKNRKWFNERSIKLCISKKETIELCRNKKRLTEFIKNSSLRINTIPTKNYSDYHNEYGYPIILKKINGRSSQGLKMVFNKTQLPQNDKNYSNYIVQPYINGTVVTVDVIRDVYGNSVAIPRKELLRTLNGAGTSVYVYRDYELEFNCKNLANELDIIGCVNFEFILDENEKYHFIECNPRFSGGIEFSCLAGYNFIKNHISCFERKRIDCYDKNDSFYIARKYEEYITKIER